ncbi:hypothetical protein QR680_016472 [Steinernema hermaphroditum]|uniref:Uncharacterized protein n=1 Tax=Steinernema hermaphroditum TaxID=289476 RepID=A0AA39LMQ0_9BILA|nr:hypothetical protein QR680_016472 [Steinernema hermaphroditum]
MMNAHEGHRTPDRSRSLSQVSENSVESDISTDANFYPAVLGLATFGVFNLLVTSIGILPLSLVGVIALCSSAFALQFFLLHGHHFCRAVHVFYDEANILETNEGFECYEGPIIDDSTPGGCCGPFPIMGPQDSFYVQHYGNMMPNALRFQKEWQEADRKRMEEKQKKSEVEQKSAGDNKNSQREQLSEKKSQTGKILEMRSEEAKKPEKMSGNSVA